MKPNRAIIKYYQLIGEGLCFYFIFVPVMALYGGPIPLWGYLTTMLLTLLILSVGIRLIQNYSIYLLSLLILTPVVVLALGFSWVASLILIGFIIWRFIIHESEPDLRNQMQLIVYMCFGFMIDAIFFYHADQIVVAVLMMLVMLGGYQMSHAVVAGSIGAKKSFPLIVGFSGIILSGSFLIFFAYQAVQSIIPYVLLAVSKTVGRGIWWGLDLIGFTGLDIEKIQNFVEGTADEKNIQPKMRKIENPFVTEEQMKAEYNPPDIINWWTIGIGIGLLLVIIFFLSRRKLQDQGKDTKMEHITSVSSEGKNTKKNKSAGIFGSSMKKPTNEIRLKVFKFERLTAKKGLGRKQSETIEEWFNRINIQSTSYLNVYQKIRYGDSDLSEYEINQFHQQLEEIKSTLNI
ncbi:hypothetical protein VBD025_00500 [Virgibacillus flavescens]|uniref:hypothetical protein n=1 Tax=Virgibacillus flavescens TaxID=1611422 RepID=UPI003D32714B